MPRPRLPADSGAAILSNAAVSTQTRNREPSPMTPHREAVLAEAVSRIAGQFAPQQIILFGSQARDDATADSDFDLLVVMDPCADARALAAKIRWALRGLPAAFDVIVQPAAHWQRWRTVPAALQHTIAAEGRVLYG